ncbi:MAG: lysozyme inhibitor LprI family protein [Chthoniobacter sp.]
MFVSRSRDQLALAVRREQIRLKPNHDPLLTRQDFLFRLNPKLEQYREAPYPVEKLRQLVDSAARRKATPFLLQEGGLAFGNSKAVLKEAADADRELNRAYQQLRQKLPSGGKEVLRQEQVRWLAERDALNMEKATALVQKRTKELRERLRSSSASLR